MVEVRILKPVGVELASGAILSFPEGWTGAVDDAVARRWIDDGQAVAALSSTAVMASLKPSEPAEKAGAEVKQPKASRTKAAKA